MVLGEMKMVIGAASVWKAPCEPYENANLDKSAWTEAVSNIHGEISGL